MFPEGRKISGTAAPKIVNHHFYMFESGGGGEGGARVSLRRVLLCGLVGLLRVTGWPGDRPRVMGGSGSSSRRVTFEADENDNVTVVKGVRLSDNVIERMKETSPPGGRPQQKLGSSSRGVGGGTPVNEEDLKKRIAEELALERARRDAEAQKRRFKEDERHARDEISKVLERERAASNEHLARALFRERAASEEERLKAQMLAKQLEEKDRELKKHDAFYKEQLGRLEERSAQFYKVTTEEFQKAVNDVDTRFKRYGSHPVCADLQSKILQCYQQNPQQTLSCSALASEYLKCVNHAKQSLAGRGG